jgi:hypothetical protein
MGRGDGGVKIPFSGRVTRQLAGGIFCVAILSAGCAAADGVNVSPRRVTAMKPGNLDRSICGPLI